MIKGFGFFSLFVFLILCSQVSGFSPGFSITFLSILSIAAGTLGYALLQFPKELETGAVSRLLEYAKCDHLHLIHSIEEISETIRKDGLLALEVRRSDLKDKFVSFLLKNIVAGYDKNEVNTQVRNRYLRSQELFTLAQSYFDRVIQGIPIVGLIATLCQVMWYLNSATGSIGVTFLPFIFSLLLQIVLQAICSERLYRSIDSARLYYFLLEEGIHGIQDGVGGEVLKNRLHTRFLDHVPHHEKHA